MRLPVEPYPDQVRAWPANGRHVLGHFDSETIVVYQAYNPAIAGYAVAHGHLGGPHFRYARMSWVKPNFLWMMFRSGWGTKPDQEATLGLRVRRTFFDTLLAAAVPSTWDRVRFPTEADWHAAVARFDVRSQWDPDHHPSGAALDRRAIQLGLRGDILEAFGRREIVEVIDLTGFVAEQRERLGSAGTGGIVTPRERVYLPADPATAAQLRLDEWVEA